MKTKKWLIVLLCAVVIATLALFAACDDQPEGPTVYTVTVDPSVTGGTITLSASSAEEGTEITVTVTPNAGYNLKEGSLKANGAVITDNKFTVGKENVTVTATFEKGTYNVTIAEDIANGEISASRRTASAGDNVVITATPAAGYKLKSVSVNGTAISGTSFTMPAANVVITAEFERETYTVTVSADIQHGTVTADKTSAHQGETITLTITPDARYVVDSIKVNNVEEGETFTMPAANVTVVVTFVITGDNLGDVTLGTAKFSATGGWNVDNDTGDDAYAVQNGVGYQYIFFKNAHGSNFVVEATVNVTGKGDDDFPRFGIAAINETNNVFFNIEGSDNLTNQKARICTGSATNITEWGAYMMDQRNRGAYTGEDSITLKMVKYDGVFYFFANDQWIGSRTFYGHGADDEAVFALYMIQIKAKYSDYSVETTDTEVAKQVPAAAKQMDGVLDWLTYEDEEGETQDLSYVSVIGSDAYAGKEVKFYAKMTSAGLYVGATAKHALYETTKGDWWTNTNFEFFVTGGAGHQFYISAMNGLTLSDHLVGAIVSSKADGETYYTTTMEGFIPIGCLPENWIVEGDMVRVGFAWKTLGDLINNGNKTGANEYWLVYGHEADVAEQQFFVDDTGIHEHSGKPHAITTATAEHATVEVSKNSAVYGETVTVTITLTESKYVVASLTVNGATLSPERDGLVVTATFAMPDVAATVAATIVEGVVATEFGSATIGTTTYNSTEGFSVSDNYAYGDHAAFVTQSGTGRQLLFFKDVVATDFVASVKVNVTGATDNTPRIGIVAVNASGFMFFNMEGSNNQQNQQCRVTFTPDFLGSEGEWWKAWDWGNYVMPKTDCGAYTGDSVLKLTLVKYEGTFYYYANDVLIGAKSFSGMKASDAVAVALAVIDIQGKFTEYSVETSKTEVAKKVPDVSAYITLDGDLSDWNSGLAYAAVIGSGDYQGKEVKFYAKLTSNGLYVGAVAKHGKYVDDNNGGWWLNTNFEFFIAGGNQYYVSALNGITVQGVLSKISHSGTEGNYTTTIEGFIPLSMLHSSWISDGTIRVGFAWKTPGDQCNNGNDGISEYWLAPGHAANNGSQQLYVSATGIKVYNVTVTEIEHATIAVSATAALDGANVVVTVTPDEGYEIATVTVNGTAITATEGVYSFTMPAENVTVTAIVSAGD